MSEEIKTLVTMLNHQRQVSGLLRMLAYELEKRADLHDLSKFREDEFEGFVEINKIARQYAYGSPEYKASIKDNKAVQLHFSRNRHHPEYHPGQVNDMDLLDFIEMVVDWLAASRTYNTTEWPEVVRVQADRFNLVYPQIFLIHFIFEWFQRQEKAK